jgi:hypothetical protein
LKSLKIFWQKEKKSLLLENWQKNKNCPDQELVSKSCWNFFKIWGNLARNCDKIIFLSVLLRPKIWNIAPHSTQQKSLDGTQWVIALLFVHSFLCCSCPP